MKTKKARNWKYFPAFYSANVPRSFFVYMELSKLWLHFIFRFWNGYPLFQKGAIVRFHIILSRFPRTNPANISQIGIIMKKYFRLECNHMMSLNNQIPSTFTCITFFLLTKVIFREILNVVLISFCLLHSESIWHFSTS